MNRYKMMPGTTISDIERYAKKEKLVFNNDGTWVSKDAEYCLFIALIDDIEIDIGFPKDLEKWDDFEHVSVMHDYIGQPYGPFYSYLKNPAEKPDPYLKTVIEKYNKKMDSLPFLEKKDEEE